MEIKVSRTSTSLKDNQKKDNFQKKAVKVPELDEFPSEEVFQEVFSQAEYDAQVELVNKIKKLKEEGSPAWKYLQMTRKDIHKVDMYDTDYTTPFPPPKPEVDITV